MHSPENTYLIDVLLPLAIPKMYSYKVPKHLIPFIKFGIRVEVSIQRKLYSGIVIHTDVDTNPLIKAKDIISIIDDAPIISTKQFTFWQWIAKYYCCTIGEVMNIALPSGLKLNSETRIVAVENLDAHLDKLKDDEFMIAEAISNQNEIGIHEIQQILGKKTVYPTIKALLEKRIIDVREQLLEKYKPKQVDYLRIAASFVDNKEETFERTQKSEKQTNTLLAIMSLSPQNEWILKSEIYKKANVDSAVINALLKKKLIEKESFAISRIKNYTGKKIQPGNLTEAQLGALTLTRSYFEEQKHILLFGVTGSGKTRVYIELIKQMIAEGKQSLFLIPEIALTTQLVQRLQKVFGDEIGIYHSRMNPSQRVEIYNAALQGKAIFIGARSSIFLPFKNLGLIIVDEEHDPSYKQSEPAPRYNGRDAALYLASIYGANVILGSATPSLETYLNATNNKFGMVILSERYGGAGMPKIEIVDLRDKYKNGLMKSMFSIDLLKEIKANLSRGEQVLLFQNRRGFSPTLQCTLCQWHAECPNCDVSLTTHKFFAQLNCHYCGFTAKIPSSCPSCGNTRLVQIGFGTEQIESELKGLLTKANIRRLDFDTARTKNQYEEILHSFETKETDILIGTQMVTKGLDFDNIGLVGILLADKIMYFPDFRANERAFQLFTQVAGRAGRRKTKGKVMIQTFNPDHAVLKETLALDYDHYYDRELKERKAFLYPPFIRLIQITIKHTNFQKTDAVAKEMATILIKKLGKRIVGPAIPGISRIRNRYIQHIMVKMEKDNQKIRQIKDVILQTKREILAQKTMSSVRIILDVDP